MPLRAPKMYSFIFGFQRRVWCPKWAPASSSSFSVTETKNSSFEASALAELEALAGAGPAVLLSLDLAWIARQEPCILQLAAQLRVVFQERARDAVAQRARLARRPAPAHADQDVELVGGLRDHQRL